MIRGARRADLPGIYRLLDVAFDDAPLRLFIDQTEGDSTLRWRHVRIAVDGDGRVLAHTRIFARKMLVRGVPVAAGGIGSVASLPEVRGDGLASAVVEDAVAQMRREGMGIGYLFTGIPAFYERSGWRTVKQPQIDVDASEAAAIETGGTYRVHHMRDSDLLSIVAIYGRATAGTTGAIARTPRIWQDAQTWLGEDAPGCLVAEHGGRAVAYLRARAREYGYQILEAEHRPDEAEAIAALLAAAGRRAVGRKQNLTALVPGDSTLARRLRALPSARETTDVTHPMMMRIVDLRRLATALLPSLRERAADREGCALAFGSRAPGGQALTFVIDEATVRLRATAATHRLDEGRTLITFMGQGRASTSVRPVLPTNARQRIDALFPETPLHFWNSDRI